MAIRGRTRAQLLALQEVLLSIPFSASGTATSNGVGAVMFEVDMRAVRPYLSKVIDGIILEGNLDLEEGWDYENPDKLLQALKEWVEIRKAENWTNPREYSFRTYWETFKEKDRG